ncbi:MAG: hypothetical protein P1U39_00410 [Legionellaceae bacterium]|nr:hypothetical protein [Legionellaceae bacterium]
MNRNQKIGFMLLLLNQAVFASKALYSITPETSSTVQVTRNSTATINYHVQNQTQQTQSLSLQNSFGITQTVQSGSCGNPFTLSPNASCLLSLVVDGSKITSSKTIRGPEICKTQSPFFCSLPTSQDLLKIDVQEPTPPIQRQYILVANGAGDYISYCELSSSGSAENCKEFYDGTLASPVGIAVYNNKYVYTTTKNRNAITVCTLDTNLATMTCLFDNGDGSTFAKPIAAYVHNDYFYTVNEGETTLTKCAINPETGGLSNCEKTGTLATNTSPLNLAMAHGYAYLPNNNNIAVCPVDSLTGNLGTCTPSSTIGNRVVGAAISEIAGTSYAYIIRFVTNTIKTCKIDVDGSLIDCFDSNQLDIIASSSITSFNNYLYITNSLSQSSPTIPRLAQCTINDNDASVVSCASTGSGFSSTNGSGFILAEEESLP